MRSEKTGLARGLAAAGALLALGAGSAFAQLQSDYQSLIQGTSSLQNYWTFEDLGATGSFTTVADVTSGKDATAIGTVESQAGLIGYAGYFPGDTDSGVLNNLLEVAGSGTDASFDLSGGSFTIEAIVQTDTLPADDWSGIVTKGDSAWRIARNRGDDHIQGAASGIGSVSNSFHDLDNGIWHYLALRYDSTNNLLTTVFDDVSQTTTVSPDDLLSTNDFTVMIGGNAEKPEREWQGFIDEVAIYTGALSDGQIADRVNLLDTDPAAIDAVAIAYWTGAQPTGTFADASGWDFDAPKAGDAVVIGKSGEVTYAGGTDTLEINELEVGTTTDLVGNDSDGPGKLIIESGTLRINSGNDTTIGKGAYGEVYQTGGMMHVRGDDYQFGRDDSNGEGRHIMTGGVLQIGDWEEDSQFSGGWFMTNDSSAGDDLAIGRHRSVTDGVTSTVAKGVLDMSGDSITRVANDVFLDVGIAELHMTDNALMHVGDDFRAASADYGEATMVLSGQANLKVEGRLSIADSNFSTTTATFGGDSLVEVGRWLVVAGQDGLGESGDGVLNIEGNATINVGAFIYRGDVDGNVGDIHEANRVADEHYFYVGAGNEGRGTGIVNQTGAGSTLTVGRKAFIGEEATGVYNLIDGRFEIRGDAPVSGVDFAAGLRDDSEFTSGGGDLVIGDRETGVGLLNVEGGQLDIARDFQVGFDGLGRLRMKGGSGSIDVGGDLSFGGDFDSAGLGSGVLEIALAGDSQTVLNVNGGADDGFGGAIPGDLVIHSADLEASFGDGDLPAAGDYSGSPLEWLIVDYAGSRSGAFDLDPSLTNGSTGVTWGVRYDDNAGEVYLQVLAVADNARGDFNGDGVVDAADYTVWRNNYGESSTVLGGNGAGGLTVGDGDLAVWSAYYGSNYGSSVAVPEPTTVALVATFVAPIALGRRSRSPRG